VLPKCVLSDLGGLVVRTTGRCGILTTRVSSTRLSERGGITSAFELREMFNEAQSTAVVPEPSSGSPFDCCSRQLYGCCWVSDRARCNLPRRDSCLASSFPFYCTGTECNTTSPHHGMETPNDQTNRHQGPVTHDPTGSSLASSANAALHLPAARISALVVGTRVWKFIRRHGPAGIVAWWTFASADVYRPYPILVCILLTASLEPLRLI